MQSSTENSRSPRSISFPFEEFGPVTIVGAALGPWSSGRFVKGFWEVQGNAKGKGNAKKKKMKGGVSSEAEPPTKKQKKVKTQNESEAAAAGKGSSEKECTKDLKLENKATLTTIVSTLDNISRKIDQIDSWLEAYELDRTRPLMDQKTIDDRVKALLEERLKDLGVGETLENNDNRSPPLPVVQTQQKSVNSPALAATPGKVFGPKKNLAKELDKESRVKRTLDEEFGNVAKATDLDSQPLDFVVISPAKATKDDKDAKVPAYGRGCRGNRIVKGEEADEKEKAAQADAAPSTAAPPLLTHLELAFRVPEIPLLQRHRSTHRETEQPPSPPFVELHQPDLRLVYSPVLLAKNLH
ncbi:hypothetical protein Bca52824_093090 [Brassica carinata]|uniref:Uncharacterized protein n=1 Tax=Brassica carinata TaxID=52824 RepID=A0A8X7P6D0_BRACI|nr:hypothetical protein Bca52824_093090 [Brassica carinata]